ncbi:MAG: hypothetical protein R2695_10530 [Acidimicrobiales bacterium]
MHDLPVDPRSFHVPASAAGVPAPPQAPVGTPGPRPPVRRRRRWPWVLLAALVVVAFPLYFLASAWWTWRGVERVDLAGVTRGSASATNYLIVGSDSRDGVDPDMRMPG